MPPPEGPTKATVSPASIDRSRSAQDVAVRTVSEPDGVVADGALQLRRGHGARAIFDIGSGIQKVRVAPEARDPLGIGLDDGIDLLDRPEEDADEQKKRDEAAGAQAPFQHEETARDQHDHLDHPHAEIAERGRGGHDPVGFQLRRAIALVVAREQRAFMILVGEGLDDADAADILLDAGVEVADAAVERLPVPRHPPAVARRQPCRQRHHQGRDQGELRLDGSHQGEGADQRHGRDEEILGTMVGHLADLLEILRQPGDEMPGLLVVEEAEGQFLQMIEGLAAHLGLDVDAEHVAPIGDRRHQPTVQDVDREEARRSERDRDPVAGRQKTIDEDLDRDGEAEFEQSGNHRATEVEDEQPAVRPVIGEETAKRGWHGADQGPGWGPPSRQPPHRQRIPAASPGGKRSCRGGSEEQAACVSELG